MADQWRLASTLASTLGARASGLSLGRVRELEDVALDLGVLDLGVVEVVPLEVGGAVDVAGLLAERVARRLEARVEEGEAVGVDDRVLVRDGQGLVGRARRRQRLRRPDAVAVGRIVEPVWKSNIQPDFNVRVCDSFDARSSVVLRELDESNRFVQN